MKKINDLKNSEELIRLRAINSYKNEMIDELIPKANYCDTILKSDELIPISVIAREYGMSGRKLNKILNELGIQYCKSGTWYLYQEFADKGYTGSKTYDFTRSDGSVGSSTHTYWTQKGRLFLYELLKSNNIYPIRERKIS